MKTITSLDSGKKFFPGLFREGQIGNLITRNRIVMPPMGTWQATDTGSVSQKHIDYYSARARGGTGMIIVEVNSVDSELVVPPYGLLRIDADRYVAGHSELVEAVHSYGAKIVLQLCHAGAWIIEPLPEGREAVGPSTVKGMFGGGSMQVRDVRGLTKEEIKDIVERFGVAALRAKRAGYDAVEIHSAHVYLLAHFLYKHMNKREDEYGGSTENRARFAVEIIKRIKSDPSLKGFPVIFRFNAFETMPEGYTLEEGKEIARLIEAAGADALHVSLGTGNEAEGVGQIVSPMSFPQGFLVPYAEAIKSAVSLPVIAVGAFREPSIADEVIRLGKADFIAFGRQSLADPDWSVKAAEGRVDDIRKCVSCNYCGATIEMGMITPIRCAINPALAREKEFEIKPADRSRNVMVVGSGPAGMEAARVAALRGHKVSLYEKGGALGDGQFRLTWIAPNKQLLKWLHDYLTTQIAKLDVDVHLNCEVISQTVAEAKPDVLIVATGAKPAIPTIPGVDGDNVVTAHDILAGKVRIEGQKVAVLGQFSTGAETANYLAEQGNKVVIVARSSADRLAEYNGPLLGARIELMFSVQRNENIEIRNGLDVKEIFGDGIATIDSEGKEETIKVDKVVLSRGVIPVADLVEKVGEIVSEVYVIGDAAGSRDIASAIYEGALVGNRI
jgi:2,4-dienoyl-CoA reductase-like NADH-dependent reductase (Old Yellow Enzyme family)/thioredoxin reductase